jgi:hypothetical protein
MASLPHKTQHVGVPGRGGASLCPLGGALLALGGSNRQGELLADALLLARGAEGAPTALPAAGAAAALPCGVGGHSATSLAVPGGGAVAVLFGGMNFAEETVAAGMYELWEGRWREVPPVHQQTPSGRTGHTLCHVPPPIALPLDCAAAQGAPELALADIVGGGGSGEALAVLFAGSTPADGPLNDLHLLRCTASGPAPAGVGPWSYAWSAPPTAGPAPPPRELHAAFVRPAILAHLPGSQPPAARLLCPAALCVHGGRSEDGAPRADLCVLDLQARTWLPPLRTPHALCSSAAAPCPAGLSLLQFGGLQGGAAGLSAGCLLLDTSAGGARGLRPQAWQWRVLALQEPQPPARFAGAAGVLGAAGAEEGAGEGEGAPRKHCLCVWGGMTVADDLSTALWVELPPLGTVQ